GAWRGNRARSWWSRRPWSWTCGRPPSALGDLGDLDRRVPLAVTPAAPVVGLALVGEPGDLRPLGLAHDLGRDLRLAERLGPGEHDVAVDHEHGGELDLAVVGRTDQLDLQLLALLDPVLLAAGLDDCVHAICLCRRARGARNLEGDGAAYPAARRTPPSPASAHVAPATRRVRPSPEVMGSAPPRTRSWVPYPEPMTSASR